MADLAPAEVAALTWCPTIDGEVGLTVKEARTLCRGFFYGGFLGLPLLWFVNCYYFWPVLRTSIPLLHELPSLAAKNTSSARLEPTQNPDEALPVLRSDSAEAQESSGLSASASSFPDAVVLLYTRWSLTCLLASALALLLWVLLFQLGGPTLFGDERWNGMLVYKIADKVEAWLLKGL